MLAGAGGILYFGAFAVDPLRHSVLHIHLIFGCATVRWFTFSVARDVGVCRHWVPPASQSMRAVEGEIQSKSMRNAVAFGFAFAALLSAQEYRLGPDSQPQPGVPKGKVEKLAWNESKIFSCSRRSYWIYVLAQYDGSKPACVMVFQDGAGIVSETGGWRVPIVFDNLIQQHAMPVTIGIFIDPGVMPAAADQQPRFNRSYEYDGLGPRYARFLVQEILPDVAKRYKLSSDPNDRAIAGSSSGGIASFTAAWERPEAFRRVLSFIGSFTNLRGDIYPDLIKENTGGARSLMFSADGRLYVAERGRKRVVAYERGGKVTVLSNGVEPIDLAVTSKGAVYFTGPSRTGLWTVDAKGQHRLLMEDTFQAPIGLRVNPDESLLVVSDHVGRSTWSFHIEPAGGLSNAEPFYHLEIPDAVEDGLLRPGGDGMTFDDQGHLYIATILGIQICDQPGRVVGIIRYPGLERARNVIFGGPDLQTLYVTAGGKVYKRRMRRKGVFPWQPVKLPRPQL